MSDDPVAFSFNHAADATPDEVNAAREKARLEAETHFYNRVSKWYLNDRHTSPGPVIAVRLRDGRFMECEDGPEVLGLSWVKYGVPDDVVEYMV